MSYMSTHNKVRRVRGSARNYACECGQQAQEWAYNNCSPVEVVDGSGRRYSLDLNDYTAMCFRCHRLKDKAQITACPQGHAYDETNTLLDAGKRRCRTCHYARSQAAQARRLASPEGRAARNAYQRAYRARRQAGEVA